MDDKIKTWPLRFPAKENSNMEKALLDWPIEQRAYRNPERTVARAPDWAPSVNSATLDFLSRES